jgi:hypothetical protein
VLPARPGQLGRPGRPGRHDERGTVLVLVIGYAVIAALLVTVVVNASIAFQTRRSLYGWADGAAVAAAQAADVDRLYDDGVADRLPLDQSAARSAVAEYVTAHDLADRFGSFAVVAVEVAPDGGSVEVTLAARSPLPFRNEASGALGGGVPITATARARGALS